LHIPKTGGRWLTSKMEDVFDYFDYNKIKIINNKNEYKNNSFGERNGADATKYYEHQGWHSEIDKDTFILTVFRDPIKQLCSLWTNSNENFIYENGLKKEIFLKDMSSKSPYLNNQSVSLSNSTKLKNFGIGFKTLDIDFLINRIDRINKIILLQENEIDYNKEIKNLLSLMQIDLPTKIEKWQNNVASYKNKNPMSKSLFNSLSDEEKQYLGELQYLDMALYNRIIEKGLK